ncbi:MAG: TIGR02444 family protein [Pseudomonadota bacterium]
MQGLVSHDTDASGLSLWQFCLQVYSDKAVAQACLNAQDDYNLDVCLLLFAAWLASRERKISNGEVEQVVDACQYWRQSTVLPLRSQRQRCKENDPKSWEYAALKRLEQQAEKEQLEFMESLYLAGTEGDSGFTDMNAASGMEAETLAENLLTITRQFSLDSSVLDAFGEAIVGIR